MPRPILRPIVIPIGPSIAYVPLTRGFFALIDSDDVEAAKGNWHVVGPMKNGDYYAKRTLPNRKDVYLHRVLKQSPEGMEIDHKSGNGLDDRQDNLRTATRAENCRNGKSCNSLGFKGVDKNKNRFRAAIIVNRKKIYLGSYKTPEEAHAAYCLAAREHHGEFARMK